LVRTRKLSHFALDLTVDLVFASFAVGDAVTQPGLHDTPAVLACELLLRTSAVAAILICHHLTVLFVLARVTVLLQVTTPAHRNARPVVTLEFIAGARDGRSWAVVFIRPIAAIVVAVTFETKEYTLATGSTHATTVATLELTLRTVGQFGNAILLVAAIDTVEIAVTAVLLANADQVGGTLKFTRRATERDQVLN
jgi:hypothetical protein